MIVARRVPSTPRPASLMTRTCWLTVSKTNQDVEGTDIRSLMTDGGGIQTGWAQIGYCSGGGFVVERQLAFSSVLARKRRLELRRYLHPQ